MDDGSPSITRRHFVRLAVLTAGAAGVGATFGCDRRESDEASPLGKRFEYDIKELTRTDPALIGYRRDKLVASRLHGAKAMTVAHDGRIVVARGEGVTVIGSKQSPDLPPDTTCIRATPDGGLAATTPNSVMLLGNAGMAGQWAITEGRPHLTCVAVHEDNVFVADAGNRIVWRYDRTGRLINRIGQRDTARGVDGFIVPSPLFDCQVDPSGGLLWVANTGRHRMEAYTFAGAPCHQWGAASMGIEGFCGCCNPCHFALLSDGRVITSEKGLPRVKRYSATGELECVVAGCEAFGVEREALAAHTPASQLGGPLVAIDDDQRVLTLHPASGELVAYVEAAPGESVGDGVA
jgi:hypothetical protein